MNQKELCDAFTENDAVEILKEVYSLGDGYGSSTIIKVDFTNDYPLQHGEGWGFSFCPETAILTIDKAGRKYKKQIVEAFAKRGIQIWNK